MASDAPSRGRLPSIPPDHDVLGHPELRDKQGDTAGVTSFQQIRPSSSQNDLTKMTPTRKSGDLKYSPSV